jgi:predicted Zn finger-like uncharacterized protein
MIIQCDQCDRKFRVDDSKIKPPGSRVRCSKCGNVFFVEKKEATKSEEKAPPPSLDNLQVDTEAKTGQEKSDIEQKVKEPPKEEIPVKNDTQPDSERNEKVWSIDQDQESLSPDLAKPSIEVDLKGQDKTEEQPASGDIGLQTASGDIGLQTDNKGPQEDSSLSWASLDKEDKQQPSNNQPSDDDLTPPVQTGPSFETKEPEAVQTQPEVSQPAAQDSTTDIPGQPREEPKLDLDIDKANQVDQQESFQSSQPYDDQFSSSLSVDQQQMSQIQSESYGGKAGEYDSVYDTPVVKSTYKLQRKSFGSKVGSFFGKIIVVLSILVIIASVGLILAVNLEILPKEKTRELRSFLVANLPINIKNPLAGIDITQTQGQWISSSNGPLFVVQGNITNFSDNIVNYIQLKTEFINNGQILYDTKIYAGNTFTNTELQTLPLNEMTNRLNRKNGDIDFSDPRKLAGKNYNLMPGDSIKFYSVFPSKSQILGLKHNVEVVDAEIILIEKSE